MRLSREVETELLTTHRLIGVGQQFANADGTSRQDELKRCGIGESVTLRAEPDNPKDGNAIAIDSVRGVQIGYISRRDAVWVGQELRSGAGVSAVIERIAPRARPFDPLVATLRVEVDRSNASKHK